MGTRMILDWAAGAEGFSEGIPHSRVPQVLVTCEADTKGHRYGAEMRVGFRELGVEAFFCVESVPRAALLRGTLAPEKFDSLYLGLWNQGLVCTLIVVGPTSIDVYSLLQKPESSAGSHSYLVETLTRVGDALALIELLESIESGDYFSRHHARFRVRDRVDEHLLENLVLTVESLEKTGLAPASARALVIQTMFLCYLEDRGLLSDSVPNFVGANQSSPVAQLLTRGDPAEFEALFRDLHRRFNGNVFFAPCAFGSDEPLAPLTPQHMAHLADFRLGDQDLRDRQLVFWPYRFQFIPVELISAIYDRLLDDRGERRRLGSFFTPRHVAEFAISQLWSQLTAEQRLGELRALDPACGSGIFLVCLFKRIVAARRESGILTTWSDLKLLVGRLHGVDKQDGAVRLAVTSLYIAMLEMLQEDVPAEMARHIPLFPVLLGTQLRIGSFFELSENESTYGLIFGNPPWASRGNRMADADAWCSKKSLPKPSGDCSWAFVWKAQVHLAEKGTIAFLMPAMGILHNMSAEAQRARRRLIQRLRLMEVINLSDISFQLFDGAKRPTVLVIAKSKSDRDVGQQLPLEHYIDYRCPKATAHYRVTRTIEIDGLDRHMIAESEATADSGVWKELLWATLRDRRLLKWMRDQPNLRSRCFDPQLAPESRWEIGQGFKPVNTRRLGTDNYQTTDSPLGRTPVLPSKEIQPFVLDVQDWPALSDLRVHRRGFVAAYHRPKILIPQGIQRSAPFLRAAYTERNIAFEHALQAIVFPAESTPDAKFLTMYLNSSLAAWFLFHRGGNFGTDRAKVLESELLELPFPPPEKCPDPLAAQEVILSAASLIDRWLTEQGNLPLIPAIDPAVRREEADDLVFKYFGLTRAEKHIVLDTARWILPSVQPTVSRRSLLNDAISPAELQSYANVLAGELTRVSPVGFEVTGAVGAHSAAVALQVRVAPEVLVTSVSVGTADAEVRATLKRIAGSLDRPAGLGMRLVPTIGLWEGSTVTLVKPNQRRHWLALAALNDADWIYASVAKARLNTPEAISVAGSS